MRVRFGWIVVGHIPKELSCYVWYSIQEGAKYDVEVYKKKPMASPLLQGGLEIPIKVSVTWDYEIDDIDFEKDKVDKDKHNDEA